MLIDLDQAVISIATDVLYVIILLCDVFCSWEKKKNKWKKNIETDVHMSIIYSYLLLDWTVNWFLIYIYSFLVCKTFYMEIDDLFILYLSFHVL